MDQKGWIGIGDPRVQMRWELYRWSAMGAQDKMLGSHATKK